MVDITVKIYSHARSHQIATADFKYDLRRIDNPPREMRRQFDGRAKRIREHLLRDTIFSRMLENAATEIDAACSNATDASGTALRRASSAIESGVDEAAEDLMQEEATDESEVEPGSHLEAKDEDDDPEEPIEERNQPQLGDDTEGNADSTRVITVSCFCERGKHRSVAFAEELAKRLSYWHVEVQHRDIEKKPAKVARAKDRHRRFQGEEDS